MCQTAAAGSTPARAEPRCSGLRCSGLGFLCSAAEPPEPRCCGVELELATPERRGEARPGGSRNGAGLLRGERDCGLRVALGFGDCSEPWLGFGLGFGFGLGLGLACSASVTAANLG